MRDDNKGLSSQEAAARLAADGPNTLSVRKRTSPWALVGEQISSPLIWLLTGACVVSAILGEVVDAIAIGAIVALNGVIGFFQEYRAENALLALRAITAPHA